MMTRSSIQTGCGSRLRCSTSGRTYRSAAGKFSRPMAPRIAWAQILWALLAMRKGRLGAYLAGVVQFLRLGPKAARFGGPWSPEERQALLVRLRRSEREIYADVTAPDR